MEGERSRAALVPRVHLAARRGTDLDPRLDRARGVDHADAVGALGRHVEEVRGRVQRDPGRLGQRDRPGRQVGQGRLLVDRGVEVERRDDRGQNTANPFRSVHRGSLGLPGT